MRHLDNKTDLIGIPPEPDWVIDGEEYYADPISGLPIWDEEDVKLLRRDFDDVH
jgi:hypothetical protein